MDKEKDQEFLEYIVKNLVDHPDDVVVTRTLDNFGVLLTLTVHPDDMGKLIGRAGKMATQTIRPLMKAYGFKHGANISVKINEPVGGKRYEADKTVDEVVDGL